MSIYDSNTDSYILWGLESAPPTVSDDMLTATLPSLPAWAVAGHAKPGQGRKGLNNSQPNALGMVEAAYNKRGVRTPGIGFECAPGSLPLIAACLRTESTSLPYLAIYEGVFGKWCRVYRMAKCGQIALNLGVGSGQSGELTVSVQFEALCSYELVSLPNVTRADLRGLGTPLFGHDIRQFTVADNEGATTTMRRGVSGLSLTCQHSLSREGLIPNLGDDVPLSLCNDEIREHGIMVSGEATFSRKLPEGLFHSAATAQNWGDIVLAIRDTPAVESGGKGFVLTAKKAMPVDLTDGAGDVNSTRTHTLSFSAANLALAIDDAEED